MFDLVGLKSHPNKTLADHIRGVANNVKQLTEFRPASLAAIWHDLGKANPNFQKKINGVQVSDYSKHSYLSAFSLFCAILKDRKDYGSYFARIFDFPIDSNRIVALIAIIAKHHGDLPDFCPEDNGSLLDKGEIALLFDYLTKMDVSLEKVICPFVQIMGFEYLMIDKKVQDTFKERLFFLPNKNKQPIDFYFDTQHTFACLIHADKADAACFDGMIDAQHKDIEIFSSVFPKALNRYLSQLKQDSALNQLRTEIRIEAVSNIRQGLHEERRVFELTSPTGSGKTLMLLSLASEIIKEKGTKRIIYALPFLSITEQVEQEVVHKIFKDYEQYIQRIDSKSENKRLEELQKKTEEGLTEEEYHELDMLAFREQSFSYPFIITTFVRFFETLLSNRNSELIKLPNFSNCIFLLDEIQTLPPRLYGFFVAYLTRFCEKYDSYAVISTATQPNFDFPSDDVDGSGKPYKVSDFFPTYKELYKLLNLTYFQNPLFNRYVVNYRREPISLKELACELKNSKDSVLVILNTIDDTKELYKLLKVENKILLNTHFTPADRKEKIDKTKRLLNEERPIIVVTTQLVEAGVDIDFPVVYRDMTTISSIVQSAGRCNRNGKMQSKGQVHIININGHSQLIYDKELLEFTKRALKSNTYEEASLLTIQHHFFEAIQQELKFGSYSITNEKERYFLNDIKECMFNKIGQFSLIDKDVYGEEVLYYVPQSESDNSFEVLLQMNDELRELVNKNSDVTVIKNQKRIIESQLKRMQNHIVQVRLKQNDCRPTKRNTRSYFNLYEVDSVDYSKDLGINLGSSII